MRETPADLVRRALTPEFGFGTDVRLTPQCQVPAVIFRRTMGSGSVEGCVSGEPKPTARSRMGPQGMREFTRWGDGMRAPARTDSNCGTATRAEVRFLRVGAACRV